MNGKTKNNTSKATEHVLKKKVEWQPDTIFIHIRVYSDSSRRELTGNFPMFWLSQLLK